MKFERKNKSLLLRFIILTYIIILTVWAIPEYTPISNIFGQESERQLEEEVKSEEVIEENQKEAEEVLEENPNETAEEKIIETGLAEEGEKEQGEGVTEKVNEEPLLEK